MRGGEGDWMGCRKVGGVGMRMGRWWVWGLCGVLGEGGGINWGLLLFLGEKVL